MPAPGNSWRSTYLSGTAKKSHFLPSTRPNRSPRLRRSVCMNERPQLGTGGGLRTAGIGSFRLSQIFSPSCIDGSLRQNARLHRAAGHISDQVGGVAALLMFIAGLLPSDQNSPKVMRPRLCRSRTYRSIGGEPELDGCRSLPLRCRALWSTTRFDDARGRGGSGWSGSVRPRYRRIARAPLRVGLG